MPRRVLRGLSAWRVSCVPSQTVRTAIVFTILACFGHAWGEPTLGTCPVHTGHDPAFGPTTSIGVGAGPRALAIEGVVIAVATHDGALVGARSDRPEPARFSTTAERTDPAIAWGATALVATWTTGTKIELAGSIDGGLTWGSPVRVDAPEDCEASTSCPRDPFVVAAKHLYIGYSGDSIGTRIRASHDNGASFGPAVTALAGTEGTAIDDGRLHVVAVRGGPLGAWGSADHAIEYTWSGDGGATFARATRVSNRDDMLPLRFARPAIASDPRRGWLYIAYVRGGHDGVWEIVVAASKDKGSTWSRTAIGDGCSTRIVPALAVDPTTGTLHVAWLDNVGGGRFAHATCAAGAAKCAEQGAIGDPFTLALDGSTGEHAQLIVDDRRRQLHAVWTQPPNLVHAVAKLR